MESARECPDFILGVERSGSTWLSNLIDAHPKTQLYMEPFAPRIEAFPGFPDRLFYLPEANPHIRECVYQGISALSKYKYPLFQRQKQGALARTLLYRGIYPISEFIHKALGAFGGRPSRTHLRFKNLNKNRIENPYLRRLRKDETPSYTVMKELRLNFKVGMLADLWPTTRVLVILRNPVSQIGSMVRLLDQGALHDLRRALRVFREYVQEGRRFSKYQDVLERMTGESLLHRSVAYWFVSYATLLEDLQRYEVEHTVIRHEELCQSTQEKCRQALSFLGMKEAPETEKYVHWSTNATNHTESVMDTRRDSESYYLEALHAVSAEVRSAVGTVGEPFWPLVPEPLQFYQEWLNEHR